MALKINKGLKSGNNRVVPLDIEALDSFKTQSSEEELLLEAFTQNLPETKKAFEEKQFSFFYGTLWTIYHKEPELKEQAVGWAFFHGPAVLGCLEITIYIMPDFRNKGLGSAALKILTQWALNQNDIYEVQAHFDDENDKAIHSFTNAGYTYREKEHHIERYTIQREHSVWRTLYVLIGIWAGCLIGIVLDMLMVGLVIGLLIGIVIGSYMDSVAEGKRASVTGTKNKSNRRKLFKKK